MRIDPSYVSSYFSKATVVSCLTQHKKITAIVVIVLGYLSALHLAMYLLAPRFPRDREEDGEDYVDQSPVLPAPIPALVVARYVQDWRNLEQQGGPIVSRHALVHIFSYLSPEEKVNCSRVCKQWYVSAIDTRLWQVPKEAFNKKLWDKLFWSKHEIPPLPPQAYHDFYQISHSPGYVPGTCLLTPILKEMNYNSFTTQSFVEHVKTFNPHVTGKEVRLHPRNSIFYLFDRKWTIGGELSPSHWTLLRLLPDLNLDITVEEQREHIFFPDRFLGLGLSRYYRVRRIDLQFLEKRFPGYEIPNILDTTVALFMTPRNDSPPSSRFASRGKIIQCQDTITLEEFPQIPYNLVIDYRGNNILNFNIRMLDHFLPLNAIQRRYFYQS